MTLTEWEIWACAQQVTKHHGANAPIQIATRIGELVATGDADGVETWKAIASCVDKLMHFRSGRPLGRQ